MDPRYTQDISQYRLNVQQANKELTKKEHFKDLLHRLFGGNPEIDGIIDSMSRGAEQTILAIPRHQRTHKGAADTLFNKVIIEFEADLKKTGKHAKEQLAGYLLGQFASGEGYNYTLIASDFIKWEIYYPTIEQISKLHELQEHELILEQDADSSFELTEGNEEEFYFWLDRFLFKEEKQKATLKRIEVAFGYQSQTFIECFRLLSIWYKEAKKYGDVQVALEQWRRFLSIAYGKFEGSEDTFLVHTYLSVFAKLLAYSVVSSDDYIDDDELKGIIDGEIFQSYKLKNFVDNDFFQWVNQDRNFGALKPVFRILAHEIGNYDFTDADEDVLKGVYQELIDLDTRHALGEYYTPDWLCERVVNEFNFKRTDKILDPSCGSGSFLRAAIHRMKTCQPDITVGELNDAVYGIDIHPLSVQIAKTTVVIALGKEIVDAAEPLRINVLMANTLLSPEGALGLFGKDIVVQIDKSKEKLNTLIFNDDKVYDDVLDVCDKLAGLSLGKKALTEPEFEKMVGNALATNASQDYRQSFYKIYRALKKTKEAGRDSIWKFILANVYRPFFLKDKFDYVVGNPPWFTYSSIKNEEYQDQLMNLSVLYNVKPARSKNMPHLEIAAIFLAHCTSYFLKKTTKEARIAFVLPRSFFSADQHENTRSGKAKGFRITNVWDLDAVSPLFRIPSCVVFADVYGGGTMSYADGIPGLELTARLPAHNAGWQVASTRLKEKEVKYYISELGKSTAFSTTGSITESSADTKQNPYKALFKQGATLVPRTFYFVEIRSKVVADMRAETVAIRTSKDVIGDAKMPWKNIVLSNFMEGRLLFRTALTRSILPFCIYKPDLVTLPIRITEENKIEMLNPMELIMHGNKYGSTWFFNAENIWKIHRTDKSKGMDANDRINYHNSLVDQRLEFRYVVIYNASAKDANAGVLDRQSCDAPFILESVAYGYYTNDELEAYYLVAMLNSAMANEAIKDFQAKGLFGPRHVHKKILDVFFPRFSPTNDNHVAVAKTSLQLSKAVGDFLNTTNQQPTKTAHELGKLRLLIKTTFEAELKELEGLVVKCLEG